MHPALDTMLLMKSLEQKDDPRDRKQGLVHRATLLSCPWPDTGSKTAQ